MLITTVARLARHIGSGSYVYRIIQYAGFPFPHRRHHRRPKTQVTEHLWRTRVFKYNIITVLVIISGTYKTRDFEKIIRYRI